MATRAHGVVGAKVYAARVYERKLRPAPFRVGYYIVARNARRILYYGNTLSANFIEKRGFAHVGSPHYGNKRFSHFVSLR